jgi:hypothetical protein
VLQRCCSAFFDGASGVSSGTCAGSLSNVGSPVC